MKLTEQQSRVKPFLLEAARRWLSVDEVEKSKGLRDAWTGLGTATAYKPVTDRGLMEHATRPNPGYSTWWRLTDAGVAIVQGWLDVGLDATHFLKRSCSDYMLVQQRGISLTDEGERIVQ